MFEIENVKKKQKMVLGIINNNKRMVKLIFEMENRIPLSV